MLQISSAGTDKQSYIYIERPLILDRVRNTHQTTVQQRSPVLTKRCTFLGGCQGILDLPVVHGEIVSSRIHAENLNVDSEQRRKILSFIAKTLPVIVIDEIIVWFRSEYNT
jgi:hypothetical protein